MLPSDWLIDTCSHQVLILLVQLETLVHLDNVVPHRLQIVVEVDHINQLVQNATVFRVKESFQVDKIDEKRLEKISHMTTLISYHSDMLERIVEPRPNGSAFRVAPLSVVSE